MLLDLPTWHLYCLDHYADHLIISKELWPLATTNYSHIWPGYSLFVTPGRLWCLATINVGWLCPPKNMSCDIKCSSVHTCHDRYLIWPEASCNDKKRHLWALEDLTFYGYCQLENDLYYLSWTLLCMRTYLYDSLSLCLSKSKLICMNRIAYENVLR